jgi:CspA family cold shock protein
VYGYLYLLLLGIRHAVLEHGAAGAAKAETEAPAATAATNKAPAQASRTAIHHLSALASTASRFCTAAKPYSDGPQLELAEGVMLEGTIKKLVADRGFGFIDTGERSDLFFHFTALQGVRIEDLREGQRIEYEEGQWPRGPRAISVRPG